MTTVHTIDGDVPTPGGVKPFQTPSKTTGIHCSGPDVLLKSRQNGLVSYKYIYIYIQKDLTTISAQIALILICHLYNG